MWQNIEKILNKEQLRTSNNIRVSKIKIQIFKHQPLSFLRFTNIVQVLQEIIFFQEHNRFDSFHGEEYRRTQALERVPTTLQLLSSYCIPSIPNTFAGRNRLPEESTTFSVQVAVPATPRETQRGTPPIHLGGSVQLTAYQNVQIRVAVGGVWSRRHGAHVHAAGSRKETMRPPI